jgi:hypothetical protein
MRSICVLSSIHEIIKDSAIIMMWLNHILHTTKWTSIQKCHWNSQCSFTDGVQWYVGLETFFTLNFRKASSWKMDISIVYYLLIETKFLVLPTLKKQWRVFFEFTFQYRLTKQFKVKFGNLRCHSFAGAGSRQVILIVHSWNSTCVERGSSQWP